MRVRATGVGLAVLLVLGLPACTSRPVEGRYDLDTERYRASFLTEMIRRAPEPCPAADRQRYVDYARKFVNAWAANERGSYIHLYPGGRAEYVQIAQPCMVSPGQPSVYPERYVGTWRLELGSHVMLESMNLEGREPGTFVIERMPLLLRGRQLVLLPSEDVGFPIYFRRQ